MRNDPNLWMIERIAKALGPLREQVVFLGGAATGLLLKDPAAPSIRTAREVEVIVEVAARSIYRYFEGALRHQGFKLDTREGSPAFRWRLDDLTLLVMPTDPELLGFHNRWHLEASQNSQPLELPSGTTIHLVAPPWFLAAKLEAFFGQGAGDYFGSHDLEDMVAVLDGRPGLVEEVRAAEGGLRAYMKERLSRLIPDEQFHYALQGHLPGDPGSQARLPYLLECLQSIAAD